MLAVALANVISALFNLYEIIIIVWCIMSWIPRRPGSVLFDVGVVLDRLVTPYINVFRRVIPPLGGIDFSPVVAVLALSIIEMVAIRLIFILF